MSGLEGYQGYQFRAFKVFFCLIFFVSGSLLLLGSGSPLPTGLTSGSRGTRRRAVVLSGYDLLVTLFLNCLWNCP